MKYSIVIPAKDEAERIGGTIESLKREFGGDAEIIVVDDGSVDGTSEVSASRGAKVVRHDANRGKGAAVKTGFKEASCDIIGFVDADGSTDVKDVKRVFDLTREYDVVIASRRIKGAILPVDQGLPRKIFGWLMRCYVNLMFNLGIVDTQCGCKALRKEAAKKIASGMRRDGFEFDVEMLWLAKKMGYSVKETGVTWTDNKKSRVSPLRDSVKMMIGLISVRLDV